MVEFQNDLHRSIALLTKNDARITRLSDTEKSQTELIFRVKEGSSDFDAEAGDQLTIIQKVLEKMSGREVLLAALALMILYFGYHGVNSYFEHKVEEKKIEAEAKGREYDLQEKKDLYEFLKESREVSATQNELLRQAYRASPLAATIGEHSRHGYDEIIRNSGDADAITIQGAGISSSVISEIRRSNRSTSEEITFKDLFRVVGVESEDPESYLVNLEAEDRSYTIATELDDPLVQSRYQKAIQRSEWTNALIMVHLVARKVGTEIKDAKIVRAYAPRKKR
jgi:hypothetical protein